MQLLIQPVRVRPEHAHFPDVSRWWSCSHWTSLGLTLGSKGVGICVKGKGCQSFRVHIEPQSSKGTWSRSVETTGSVAFLEADFTL